MSKQQYTCDMCGKVFERHACYMKGKKHSFCCRECLWAFSSKTKNPEGYANLKDFTNVGAHFSELNRKLNPTRMTPETREKLRKVHLNTGEGRTYAKEYSQHAHRVVMERKLGRKLRPGEVVHHIDGDKRNNDPDNLMLFPSIAEHSRYHMRLNLFFAEKGGDRA